MSLTLLLNLILAHVIGDFILQPTKWIKDKEVKKHKSKYLYIHIAIHLGLLLLAVRFNPTYILATVIIALSHLVIDIIKLNVSNQKNRVWVFVLDQVFHVIAILITVQVIEPYIEFSDLWSNKMLLRIGMLLTFTQVVSIFMQEILKNWSKKLDLTNALDDAGKYIGMLERTLIFGFIVIGQWSVIGFLLAAKSVFRFGDLNKDNNLKLTEFVLIGTLLSFGSAIVLGLLYVYLEKLV